MMNILLKIILFTGIGISMIGFLFLISFLLNRRNGRLQAGKQTADNEKDREESAPALGFCKKYRNTLLIGILLCVHLIGGIIFTQTTVTCDTPVQATITHIRKTKKTLLYDIYYMNITYVTHENETYKGLVNTSADGWNVGDQMDILYSSEKPARYTVPVQLATTEEMIYTSRGRGRSLIFLIIVYGGLTAAGIFSDKVRMKNR